MKILVALVALLCPVSAAAQSLEVYTGEHEAFTRVVIEQPKPGSWLLEKAQENQLRIVRSADANLEKLDLSEFFARIDRSKIKSVSIVDDRDLALTLKCDCELVSTNLPAGYFVLDILNGPKDPPEKYTGPAVPLFAGSSVTSTTSKRPSLEDHHTFKLTTWANRSLAQSLSQEVENEINPNMLAIENHSVLTAAGSLLSQFEDAMVYGAITPNHLDGDDAIATIKEKVQTDAKVLFQNVEKLPGDCEWIAKLTDFSSANGNYGSLSQSRQRLVALDGNVSNASVATIAKSYISLGWGQEAKALLRQFSIPENQILFALADSVESGIDNANFFSKRLGCGEQAHLWALMSKNFEADFIDQNAARRAFQTLPTPMQEQIAPFLFAVARENDLAKFLTGIEADLALDGRVPGDTAVMPRLDMKIPSNRSILKELSGSRSEDVALDAILTLAETSESREEAASLAPLVAALGTERTGTEDAVRARVSELSAMLTAGEYREVFESSLQDGLLTIDQASALIKKSMIDSLADANEAAFLRFFFVFRDAVEDGHVLPEKELLDIADRALDLGLDRPVSSLVEAVSDPRLLRRRKLLEAQVALATGQFTEAELIAISLDGPDALAIRRSARAAMEDYEFLSTSYDALGSSDEEMMIAVLAEDWGLLAQKNGPWAEASKLIQNAPGELDESNLDSFEDLLGKSASARTSLDDLLTETSLSPQE
ncbi:hypothetical protein [Roseivivax sp. CAU 1753]